MADRSKFNSKLGLILASAGSAVGLGNIWRFPTEVGTNGGAAFILLYLLCILAFGLPIMLGEFMIGRHSRVSVGRSYKKILPSTHWKWNGRLQVLTPFLILCYYNVVAGWTLYYLYEAIVGNLGQLPSEEFEPYFNTFTSSVWTQISFLLIFMLLTHVIIVRGVTAGIEKFSKIMMPGLFVILIGLVVCSLTMDGAPKALSFLFTPDFTAITPSVVLSAMGQAFYSLSLGMGILTTYASYFKDETNLGKTALSICGLDTMVSIMAGLVIFPAVFSVGAQVDAGPSLTFIALPGVFNTVFQNLTWLGYIFSVAFYALLVLATLTSAISIHEAVTSYLSEAWNWSRKQAAWFVSGFCIVFGTLCALSFGPLADFKVFDLTIFELFDAITANILLPIAGLFISLFAGWRLPKRVWWTQMTNNGTRDFPFFSILIFTLRWICPLGIAIILLNQLGIFKMFL